jgi:hypothetical protein
MNPTGATTVNLVYSATAFGVFCWIAGRRWACYRNLAAARNQPGTTSTEERPPG